jgi:hypothetical protein
MSIVEVEVCNVAGEPAAIGSAGSHAVVLIGRPVRAAAAWGSPAAVGVPDTD